MKRDKVISVSLIIFVALAIRFFSFCREDILTRDSINFVEYACKFLNDPASLISPGSQQEPTHVVILAATFKLLYPHLRLDHPWEYPYRWERVLFVSGAVFTVISILLLYKLVGDLWGHEYGIVASLLYAVHKEAVLYSIWGLSETTYTANTLFVISTIYFSATAEGKGRVIWASLGGAGCFWFLSLLRKEAVLIIIAVLAYIVFFLPLNRPARIKVFSSFIAGFVLSLLAYVFILGGGFPWFEFFWRHTIDWRRLYRLLGSKPALLLGVSTVGPIWIYTGLAAIKGLFVKGGYLPAPLALGYAFVKNKIPARISPAIFVLVALAQAAAFQGYLIVRGWYVGRYLFLSSVMLLVFSAAFLVYIRDIATKVKPRWLIIALVAIIMAAQAVHRYVRPPRGYGRDILEAARWIEKNLPQDAVIIASDCRIGFYSRRKYGVITMNLEHSPLQVAGLLLENRGRPLYSAFVLRDKPGHRIEDFDEIIPPEVREEIKRVSFGKDAVIGIYKLHSRKLSAIIESLEGKVQR